jgi:hypothetical protein
MVLAHATFRFCGRSRTYNRWRREAPPSSECICDRLRVYTMPLCRRQDAKARVWIFKPTHYQRSVVS